MSAAVDWDCEKDPVMEHAMEIHGLDARVIVVDGTVEVGGVAEQEHAMEVHGLDAREVVVDATDSAAEPVTEPTMEIRPAPGQKMMITAFAPDYGSTTLPTKVMVSGVFSDDCREFSDDYLRIPTSELDCMCGGDMTVEAKFVQPGVYTCSIPPQPAGRVSLRLSFEGVPISDALSFEFLDALSSS